MTFLGIQDLKRLQDEHPEYRMELVDGAVIIMSPSGYESDEVALEFARLLANWVRPRRLGRVTGSSAGFILPNTDLRAPDVSFVRAERLRRTTRSYAELVPDLMVEVQSPSDSTKKLRDKIQEFLSLGAKVGILVDPIAQTIEIYRLGESKILNNEETLTIPDLLPGFAVAISELWSPVFEEE
ncbi:MAG: Uma2 family endonuclease [Cyanophyceae cyanobacterium]